MHMRPPGVRSLPRCIAGAALLFTLIIFAGCRGLRPHPAAEYVYVQNKEVFLRDRVAAVSNRVGMVSNGQRLLVMEHSRRFLRVKTEKGEIGWIENHAVITEDVYSQFQSLVQHHLHDPVVATAILRDDLYLHVAPGRTTERYYLLPENDKLQLLVRASVAKPMPPGTMAPQPRPDSTPQVKPAGKTPAAGKRKPISSAPPPSNAAATGAPIVPLEDWWLIRDSAGHVGWMLSRRMDVDVPDEIAGYSEGQKMVGAYVLTTVNDPESAISSHQVPEYVSVLNAYQDGLPYDFDQVRVFTWNLKKHRYETAYRQRGLRGYLPVMVAQKTLDKAGTVPTFTIQQAADDAVTTDTQTGSTRPANLQSVSFRMDGVMVRKIGGPAPPPLPKIADGRSDAKRAVQTRRRKHR
jgi:hypothetical protein